jgi:hypothetical protein
MVGQFGVEITSMICPLEAARLAADHAVISAKPVRRLKSVNERNRERVWCRWLCAISPTRTSTTSRDRTILLYWRFNVLPTLSGHRHSSIPWNLL